MVLVGSRFFNCFAAKVGLVLTELADRGWLVFYYQKSGRCWS